MKKRRGWAWMAVSALGCVALLGGGALLAAAHDRPLAAATENAGPADALRVVHVLTDGCPCSRAVAEHLLRRHPMGGGGISESVQVICEGSPADADLIAQLREAGFPVTTPTSLEAHRKLGVNGGPVLVIFHQDGTVAYSGGYASERPTGSTAEAAFRDVAIAGDCLVGRSVTRLPALGCTAGKTAPEALRDLVQLPLNDR